MPRAHRQRCTLPASPGYRCGFSEVCPRTPDTFEVVYGVIQQPLFITDYNQVPEPGSGVVASLCAAATLNLV